MKAKMHYISSKVVFDQTYTYLSTLNELIHLVVNYSVTKHKSGVNMLI